MSPPLPTEAGCDSRERIVLPLVFIARLMNEHILADDAARQ